MQPSEATASTSSSASLPAASRALPIAAMSFCTPDAVSTCVDQNRLDAAVGLELRLDRLRLHRAAVIARQHLDLRAQHLRGLAPGDREAPAFQHQHLVAAREHVGERGLPGAVAVRRVDVGAPRGVEDARHVGEQPIGERDQRPRIDVDRRLLHGGEHGIRDDGRTRDGEEFTAGGDGHGGPYAGTFRRLPSMFCRAVRSMNLTDGSRSLKRIRERRQVSLCPLPLQGEGFAVPHVGRRDDPAPDARA